MKVQATVPLTLDCAEVLDNVLYRIGIGFRAEDVACGEVDEAGDRHGGWRWRAEERSKEAGSVELV